MDEQGAEPAPTDSQGNLMLNFGTAVQGSAKQIVLYAKNDIEFPMQLEPIFEKDDPDLKITRFPPILRPGEIQPVTITFTPSIDRVKPLQTSWDFRKIILNKI